MVRNMQARLRHNLKMYTFFKLEDAFAAFRRANIGGLGLHLDQVSEQHDPLGTQTVGC